MLRWPQSASFFFLTFSAALSGAITLVTANNGMG